MVRDPRAVTEAVLASATAATVHRGTAYLQDGRVTRLRTDDGCWSAHVQGAETYAVAIDEHQMSCTCPAAESGWTCKHVVAVALAAVGDADDPTAVRATRSPDDPQLVEQLVGLGAERLAQLLARAADDHPELARRLPLETAAATGRGLSVLGDELDAALSTRRYVDYWRSFDVRRDAEPVLDRLAALADGPAAADVVPLVRRAIRRSIRLILNGDDSAGMLGDISRRLLDIHEAACRNGRPDPVKLARWMVAFEHDDQDFFALDVRDYADALGEKGVERYRRETLRRLEAEPSSSPAEHALQCLALLDDDVDAVVQHFGGPLSAPHHFARVAEALHELHRDDEALVWCLRGLELPLTYQSRALFDLASRLHQATGDLDAAVTLRSRQLAWTPDLASYTALQQAARASGRWDKERPAALATLGRLQPIVLTSALLHDGDLDAAWAAATGHEGIASADDLRRLTTLRAETHPSDAVPFLRMFAEEAIRGANRDAYRTCVTWLLRLRTAHERLGTPDDFARCVEDLRTRHRRRPALLDELRRAQL